MFSPIPITEFISCVTTMVVAAVGILMNGAMALLFVSGRKGDLNVRGAFLHMVVMRPSRPC